MFKHLPVAHFHDATFLTKHIEVYRRAVVTEQIRGIFAGDDWFWRDGKFRNGCR